MAKKKTYKFTPADEAFCQHYAQYGNATQAYLSAYPKVVYTTAKAEGPKKTAIPCIAERIEAIKEEFAVSIQQTKERTVEALILSAEEAKAAGQFNAYAKMRDMIIKMCGFYEPNKIDVTSQGDKITINLDLTAKKEDDRDKPNLNG